MKPRTVTEEEVKKDPNCIWNAFIDLIVCSSYEDLTSAQRAARLVWLYDSEVLNGGRLQFFQNHGAEHLTETVQALGLMEAADQQRILLEAMELSASVRARSFPPLTSTVPKRWKANSAASIRVSMIACHHSTTDSRRTWTLTSRCL